MLALALRRRALQLGFDDHGLAFMDLVEGRAQFGIVSLEDDLQRPAIGLAPPVSLRLRARVRSSTRRTGTADRLRASTNVAFPVTNAGGEQVVREYELALELGRQRCSVCRSEVGHLVVVCFHEGRSGSGARDVGAARREFCEPIEPIDEA